MAKAKRGLCDRPRTPSRRSFAGLIRSGEDAAKGFAIALDLRAARKKKHKKDLRETNDVSRRFFHSTTPGTSDRIRIFGASSSTVR